MPVPDPAAPPLPRSLLDHLGEGIAAFDRQWRILYVNPSAAALVGRAPEELIGRTLTEVYPRAADLLYYDAARRALTEGVSASLEMFVPELDAWFAIDLYPGPDGLTVVTRNVTARRREEAEREELLRREQQARAKAEAITRELAEAYALLDTIFEQAPIGLAFWNRELQFVRLNQAMAEMNGLPVEAHLGKRPTEILPDLEGLEEAMEAWRRIIATGEAVLRVEVSGQTPAAPGVRRAWLENWYPVRLGEEIIGLGAVVEEITERKANEAERERLLAVAQAANAEAQAAVAVRDAFLANVSHDLRTPLTTIKGYAQVLRRRLSGAETPEAAALTAGLTTIEHAAIRMTAMLEELVDAAQMQSGHVLELVRRPTDLVALARRTVAEHQQAAPGHRLVVTATVPELTGPWDGVRLERVLGNLLSNAVKYSPDESTVAVTVTRESAEGTEWACLRVQDEGIGIPAADQPYIFERFFRGGNVTGRIRGTGIGLAGAKSIVEGHGGKLTLTSVEGRGSAFTVWLPLGEC